MFNKVMRWLVRGHVKALDKAHEAHVEVRIPRIYQSGGGWGDAINWSNWDTRRVVGWKTPRPVKGDLLHGHMESGKIAVFVFEEVEYMPDPPDMFFATVKDRGYLGQEMDYYE